MGRNILGLAILLSMLLLVACNTGYHPVGLVGGYSDFKLADNAYLVTFRGNGYTSSDKATKYALRRSADLTKQKGYEYFVIENSSTTISKDTYTTPVQANTTYNNSTMGNYMFGTSNTQYTGGEVTTIHRPTVSFTVRMYHEPVPGALKADTILNNFTQ